MRRCIIRAPRELRGVIIKDYITPLRPYGDKIRDFVLMSLNACELYNNAKYSFLDNFFGDVKFFHI